MPVLRPNPNERATRWMPYPILVLPLWNALQNRNPIVKKYTSLETLMAVGI